MGWLTDIAAGVLRGAGKSDLADWLKDAPKKLGEEIGQILVEGQEEGGTISNEALLKLEELRKENAGEATPQPHDLEDEYAADLNAFVNLARAGEPSASPRVVAVRGFLHDEGCCAVWIIDLAQPASLRAERSPFASEPKKILIVGQTIRIYLLGAKTDAELVEMNRSIERDSKAFIERLENDYQYMVRAITKNSVTVETMPKPGKQGGKESDCPIEGRAGIAEAFRTLALALFTQGERLREYRRERSNSSPLTP